MGRRLSRPFRVLAWLWRFAVAEQARHERLTGPHPTFRVDGTTGGDKR